MKAIKNSIRNVKEHFKNKNRISKNFILCIENQSFSTTKDELKELKKALKTEGWKVKSYTFNDKHTGRQKGLVISEGTK